MMLVACAGGGGDSAEACQRFRDIDATTRAGLQRQVGRVAAAADGATEEVAAAAGMLSGALDVSVEQLRIAVNEMARACADEGL